MITRLSDKIQQVKFQTKYCTGDGVFEQTPDPVTVNILSLAAAALKKLHNLHYQFMIFECKRHIHSLI